MHILKSKNKDLIHLYNKIVFLTRENFFYIDIKLSDSFSNRIYLIFFHLSFILVVLKTKKIDIKKQQAIFDFFFKQIEINCRELGYGDISVNKKMKNLIKMFYEILFHCHNWKSLEINKKNDLLLKFFAFNSSDKILTNKLTNYFDKFSLFLEEISLNLLTKGVFKFDYKGYL